MFEGPPSGGGVHGPDRHRAPRSKSIAKSKAKAEQIRKKLQKRLDQFV